MDLALTESDAKLVENFLFVLQAALNRKGTGPVPPVGGFPSPQAPHPGYLLGTQTTALPVPTYPYNVPHNQTRMTQRFPARLPVIRPCPQAPVRPTPTPAFASDDRMAQLLASLVPNGHSQSGNNTQRMAALASSGTARGNPGSLPSPGGAWSYQHPRPSPVNEAPFMSASGVHHDQLNRLLHVAAQSLHPASQAGASGFTSWRGTRAATQFQAAEAEQPLPAAVSRDAMKEETPEKLEQTRKRNREAQHRFRERQRAMAIEAQNKWESLADDIEALESENHVLEGRMELLGRLISVRDAFLLDLVPSKNSIKNPGADLPVQQDQKAASQGDVCSDAAPAIVITAATEPRGAAVMTQDHNRTSIGERSLHPVNVPHPKDFDMGIGLNAEAPKHSTGSEASIEQVRPTERPEYTHCEDRACALALDTPEKYASYYRQWQVDTRFELEYAKESGMTSVAVHHVEQMFQKMLRIWSFNVEVYEENFRWMVQRMLPPDGEQLMRWRKIAEIVLKRLEMKSLVELRKRFKEYVLEMEEIDRQRHRWAGGIRTILSASAHKPASWASAAEKHIDVGECAANLECLSKRELNAVKQLALTWATTLGDFNAAVCNMEAEPYIPNWVAISSQIVEMALERGLLKNYDDSNDRESTDRRANVTMAAGDDGVGGCVREPQLIALKELA